MSMLAQAQLRLKVLELAKDLLHNAYVDKKAHTHNEWSARAEVAWKSQGVRLPYPDFPPYFDENELIEKADRLLNFVLPSLQHEESHTTPAANSITHNQPTPVPPQPQPVPEPLQQEQTVLTTEVEPVSLPLLQPPITDPPPEGTENVVSKPLKLFGNWRRS